MLALFGLVGVIVVVLAGIIAIAAGQAWILQHVWQWYAVQQFGMPPLRLSHCYLLTFAVGLLTHQRNSDDAKKPWASLSGLVLGWVLFLGFAWWLR
jgi:hypothetical protein